MKVLTNISDRKAIIAIKSAHAKTGFVPTMGYLHAGHTSFLERCKLENNHSIFSISNGLPSLTSLYRTRH